MNITCKVLSLLDTKMACRLSEEEIHSSVRRQTWEELIKLLIYDYYQSSDGKIHYITTAGNNSRNYKNVVNSNWLKNVQ